MWECCYQGEKIVVLGGKAPGEYLLLKEPFCLKCAFPGVSKDEYNWHWKSYGFERIYAMGAYYPSRGSKNSVGWNDCLSKHIRGLKMYPNYAVPLGLGLALCIKKRYTELSEMDLIVPVPKFRTKLKKARDQSAMIYNQSSELSKVISDKVNIPYVEALRKTREQRMKELSWEEKWEVVNGLYSILDAETVKNKRVILVDDVSTSGATVSECAKVLREAGAVVVNVLIAGRDVTEGA